MNNHLVELPISSIEKYDILKQRFIGEDDKYIKYLSELPSLRYFTNQPTFIQYYIEDDKAFSRSISCNTSTLESIKSDPFPNCYVLYGFQEMNGTKYVRGAYIKYDGEAHKRMRDNKINEIIGNQ
jgi:hypothetical protein